MHFNSCICHKITVKSCFFFISSIQSLAIWIVMKFYHMLRSGMSWKLNETIIELWHGSYDTKTSTTHSFSDILDNEQEEFQLNIDANRNESFRFDGSENCCRKRLYGDNDDEEEENCDECSSDNEFELNDHRGQKQIGNGLNEFDLLLCERKIMASSIVWQKALWCQKNFL
jgi:hypothetical protein